MGFGGGPRVCIGLNFTTVEIKAMAATILRRFEFAPEPGQEVVQVYQGTGGPLHGIRVSVREL